VEVNMGQRQHQNTTTGSQAQEDRVVLQIDLTRREVEALHALLTEAKRRGELPEVLKGVWRGLEWVRAYERWREEGGEWPFGPDLGLRGDS
jgi:DNA-binding response OmpR family regulator